MHNIEIERKFLVVGDFKSESFASEKIVQGYIAASSGGRSVRIRIRGDKGYITIKGATSDSGMSRFEWEKEITFDEAEELMKLCDPGVIDKIRYLVKCGSHVYEVDEFYGENEGLVIAEIELQSEDEAFEKPLWLGREVTGDARYYNAQLVKKPYTKWNPVND